MSRSPMNELPNHAEVPAPGDGSVPEPLPRPEARRIPNIGHAALFAGFAAMLFLLLQLALVVLGLSPVSQSGGQITVTHPMLQIAVLGATYAGTLAAAWLFFPLIWHEPFGAGLQWNWQSARKLIFRLLGLGLLLGTGSAVVSAFITQPKQPPIDQFFPTATAAWLITVFGTLGAPVFEEIAFRGFLLPAFAIAFDWVRMPRTEAGHAKWQTTATVSAAAWIFSALVTSVSFVRIHADQIGNAWGPLLVLFCVSLVLTWVRIKTRSVAASTMVHAAYNGLIFLLTIAQTDGYRHLEKMAR